MNRERKEQIVEEIARGLGGSDAVFAIDYRGISVPQAAALRTRLADADASFRVVKNTLTRRAAEQAEAATLLELLEGPTALTFVNGDVALAAKAIRDFNREHALLEFKGGLMGGDPLTVEELQALARLPARDVLYGQLVGTVSAPLTGLVRGLGSMLSGLALQLQAIVDQGLLPGGEAPAGAPAAEGEASAGEAPSEEASKGAGPAAEGDSGAGEEPAAEEEAAAEEETSDEGEQPADDASANAGDSDDDAEADKEE